ncbi:MAG: hypothetical protein AAFW46_02120 [Pseudomonadota bacterium]
MAEVAQDWRNHADGAWVGGGVARLTATNPDQRRRPPLATVAPGAQIDR